LIEVEQLHKSYGTLQAVKGVSLVAKPGSIFGLLGPNGAGKSTTIGCISGLIKPSSGRIRVLGQDMAVNGREARQQLGVVPQELALYEDLSARENLHFWGGAYGLSGKALRARTEEVLQRIGLLDRANDRVSKFSGGMKRRLNLGCGIVHRPRVLLLDEPTVGVDPQSRVHLLDLVREEVGQGICVLYTTHYMEEAETLCNELAIVDHGVVIAAGTLAELRARVGQRDLLVLKGVFDATRSRTALSASGANWEIAGCSEQEIRLVLPDATRRLPEVLAIVTESGAEIHEATLSQPSLENLFMQLTGKRLRE
jgi:ABC-2 type transport system ATP-binding protein